MNISELKPGRELDALVAQRVMHRPPCLNCNGPCDSRCGYHPHYSTDIAAAWEVVEAMRAKYFDLRLTTRGQTVRADFFVWVSGANPTKRQVGDAVESTAPHAICLAALKAVGVDTVSPPR